MKKPNGRKLREAAAFTMFASGGLWLCAATVYYDNSVTKWASPKAHVWNSTTDHNTWPGAAMTQVSGYDNLWSFDSGSYANVIFNNGMSGDALMQTIDLTATDGKVYKMTSTANKGGMSYFSSLDEWKESLESGGDNGGDNGDGNGGDNDTDAFWLEPASPKINQEVTIHFNAAAAPGVFKDKNTDLYLHLGLAFGKEWKFVLTDWNNLDDKFRMTRDADNPNRYTYTIGPTISEFFNIGDDMEVDGIAFIVRDTNGTKAQDADVFIPITRPLDPSTACVGRYTGHKITDGTLTVKGEWGQLLITPYADNIVKVFTLPESATIRQERRSITVSATPQPLPMAVTEDTDSEVVFTFGNGQTLVHINKEYCTVTFTDSDGNHILAEQGGLDNRAGKRGVTFAAMNDAAFYGGGYNGARTDWNNVTMLMDNRQTSQWHSGSPGPRCINVPFYVSTGGYGVLFDDHYRNAEITPSANGTRYTTGAMNPIAYYFVGGGSMEKVMENYTWLTGRQQMPPYWFLGYTTSRYGYTSFTDADNNINAIKGAGIPLDGVVFDLFWQGTDESGMGNLDWEGSNFGNATSWLKGKKDSGVHTVIITEPFFTSKSRNYATLKSKKYLADESVNGMEWLKSENVGLIDAANPEAMEWMVEECYIPRTREGVDGMWLDLGEPERHDDDSNHQGGSVAQVHNEFGNLWIEAVYNGLRKEFPDMRPMLMPRAGTSGMQRFSTFPWTGDIQRSWSGLQAQIPALVSASMSGIGYIGSDVGGFEGAAPDPRLYLRWVQQAVFTPMIRTHAQGRLLPEPSNDCYNDVRDDVRRFINLHYQYLPYTYTLAWRNATKGTPLARPVNMYDSNPATLASVKDEYLWGRDILVAPVVENAESRTVRFPEGKWLDLNDYTGIYSGTTQYSAPLGKLPYFGRVGSFIPRFTATTFTNTASISHTDYTIDYIADPDGGVTEGFLFEDDRTTPSVNENYKYLVTKFHGVVEDDKAYIYIWRYDQNDSDIDGSPSPVKEGYDGMAQYHTYTFVIHNMPAKVRAGASVRAKAPSAGNSAGDDFAEAESVDALMASGRNAYFIDSASGKAYIKATLPTDTHQIIQVSGDGAIMTGADAIEADNNMYLSYADGMLSYSLAPEMTGGRIEVYSASGAMACSFEAGAADGTVHQTPANLAPGVYVARISATDASQRPATKRIKIAAR